MSQGFEFNEYLKQEHNVEIDQFEDDNFHKIVFEGEIINEQNQIKQLF